MCDLAVRLKPLEGVGEREQLQRRAVWRSRTAAAARPREALCLTVPVLCHTLSVFPSQSLHLLEGQRARGSGAVSWSPRRLPRSPRSPHPRPLVCTLPVQLDRPRHHSTAHPHRAAPACLASPAALFPPPPPPPPSLPHLALALGTPSTAPPRHVPLLLHLGHPAPPPGRLGKVGPRLREGPRPQGPPGQRRQGPHLGRAAHRR